MKRSLLLSVFIFAMLVGILIRPANENEQFFSNDKIENENKQEKTQMLNKNKINCETGNYEQFKAINEEVVYALHFSDRILPVVYNEDNEYYVRRNLAKESSSMGTPFVDQYIGMNNRNMLIHAHSSLTNEGMFTFFKYFREQEYYEEHSFFYLENEEGMKKMEIFAVLQIDLDEDDYRDWMKNEWRSESEFMNFIEDVRSRSLIESEVAVVPDDCIITLVTCDMSVENGRFLVFAKRDEK